MTDPSRMSAVVHRETGYWLAECIEYGYYDIGKTIHDAVRALVRDANATAYTANREYRPDDPWEVGTRVNSWELMEDGTWKPPLTRADTALRFDDAISCCETYGLKALRLFEGCVEYIRGGKTYKIPQEL